jgi:hypothetical protein
MGDHVTTDVELPMVGWECRYCGEPYNSRTRPGLRYCRCGRETIWELPDDRIDMYRDRLDALSVGDECVVVPEHGAALVGTVTDVRDDGYITLGGTSDSDRGTVRVIDIDALDLYRRGDDRDPGDSIIYVETNDTT